MERRLAVHAGDHPAALNRLTRIAGIAAVGAVVLAALSLPADARPRRRDARTAFDRGLAAYKKRNFEAASVALARSFNLERDADTLFAWAQAQRQLERCDKAIELYEKLLAFKLPAANRKAVEAKLDECRNAVAERIPQPPPPPPPQPQPQPPPLQPKIVAIEDLPHDDASAGGPAASAGATGTARGNVTGGASSTGPASSRWASRASRSGSGSAPSVTASSAVASSAAVSGDASGPPRDAPRSPRRWYQDPITLGLAGSGVVLGAIGGALLVSASSLDGQVKPTFEAHGYDRALEVASKARSRDDLGWISIGVGSALIVGGAVWMIMHRGGGEPHVVTGWLGPDGGGVAVTGGF